MSPPPSPQPWATWTQRPVGRSDGLAVVVGGNALLAKEEGAGTGLDWTKRMVVYTDITVTYAPLGRRKKGLDIAAAGR